MDVAVDQGHRRTGDGSSHPAGATPTDHVRHRAGREPGALVCSWRVWGARATLGVTVGAQLHRARLIVDEVVAAIDRACNRFVPDSNISCCNREAGRWVTASPTFLEALDVALAAARDTGGVVDPTVGSALVALGYDRDFDQLLASEPEARRLPPGRAAGWERVEIDRRGSRVRVPPGTSLDLGATAKALCVDRATGLVTLRLGIGVLVDIGGDLAVAGEPAPGGWNIAVQESSQEAGGDPDCVVAVSDGALASSGTTVRRWKVGGTPVHHIIDPRTGEPAPPVWRMVTVSAPTCVEANVAATASIVWGRHALRELGRRARPARLVDSDGGVTAIGGWPEEPARPRSFVPPDRPPNLAPVDGGTHDD